MRESWCVIVVAVLLSIVAIVLGCVGIDAYRDCRYIEAGYTQQMLPGHSWPRWVKGSPNDCNGAAPVPGLDPRNWIVSEPVPLSSAAGGNR